MGEYIHKKKNAFIEKVKKAIDHYDRIYIGDFPLILSAINSFIEDFKYNDFLNNNKKERISLQKACLKSNFVGDIGNEVKINNCTIFKIIRSSKHKGRIIKVYDEKYNIYSFFLSNKKQINFELFKKIPQISGRIKNHKEINGIRENWISYVRISRKYKNKKKDFF